MQIQTLFYLIKLIKFHLIDSILYFWDILAIRITEKNNEKTTFMHNYLDVSCQLRNFRSK